MAALDWPLGEMRWTQQSSAYSPADIERRMVTPAGTRKKRIGTTGPDVFSGEIILTAPEFAYWVGWQRHVIASGMQWVTVPAMAAGLVTALEVRIPVSALQYARSANGGFRVSARWETLAGTEISLADYLALGLPDREWPWPDIAWSDSGYGYAPTDTINRYETSHGSAQWPRVKVAPDGFSASMLLPGHATDVTKNIFGQFVAWLRYGLKGRWFKCVIAANGTVEPRIIRFVGGSLQYRLAGVNHWLVQTQFESRMSTELGETPFSIVDLYGTGSTTPYSDFARALSDTTNGDETWP